MVVAKNIHVVATMGTSPGIVGELVYNIMARRVEGLVYAPDARVASVTVVGTAHRLVMLAARAVQPILECCLGYTTPVTVKLINSEDVVDSTSYQDYYNAVRDTLQQYIRKEDIDYVVVLDITGGRASMAVAAFEAAYHTVSRGRLYITTTQVPTERYSQLQSLYRALANQGLENALQEYYKAKTSGNTDEACKAIKAVQAQGANICSLVTREAETAVLRIV